MQLRSYQQECVDRIDNIAPGSYLVVLPVGSGKTVIFSHLKRRGRVLILSHRDELVHQPEKYYDCSFGAEIGNETSNGEEVVSASVQSLVRRLGKFSPDDFDMIITDEAHHAVAPSYQKIYAYFHPRIHIGFTATPNRADKVGLAKIYSEIIFHRDMRWAIRQGYLCDIKCLRVDIGYDVSKVKRRMGDFDMDSLNAAVNRKVMNQGVAKAYKKYAVGQTLVFAMNVSHAERLAKEIRDIMGNEQEAEVITGQTADRDKVLDRFRSKELRCIVNCMVLTEGTDLPMIETVIMARPTSNESLYCQAVGRGTRLYPGKKFLTLVDCLGMAGRTRLCAAPCLFGLDDSVVPERKQKELGEIMLTETEKKIMHLADNPEAWIMNAKKVDLFAEDMALDMHGVNWRLLPDTSLTCSIGSDGPMQISPVDELGKCRVSTKEWVSEPMFPQDAMDYAHRCLSIKYAANRKLWDIRFVKQWGAQPASDKQKALIRKLLSQPENIERFDCADYDPSSITKGQASAIISRLTECNN